MFKMKLIDSKLSGNAWKVRLVLRHLKIAFERETLNLMDGTHKSESFARVNPFKRIPVLILSNGQHIVESNAILEYLANGTSLMPDDPVRRAEVRAWLFFEQSDLMRFLAYPRFYAMSGQTDRFATVIEHYQELAKSGLSTVNKVLSTHNWICGDDLLIADFALYPYIKLAPEGGLNLSDWPSISAWIDRFECIENYETLVPGQSN